MPIDALSILCVQLKHDLLAIAKFLVQVPMVPANIFKNTNAVYFLVQVQWGGCFVFCITLRKVP